MSLLPENMVKDVCNNLNDRGERSKQPRQSCILYESQDVVLNCLKLQRTTRPLCIANTKRLAAKCRQNNIEDLWKTVFNSMCQQNDGMGEQKQKIKLTLRRLHSHLAQRQRATLLH